jgi:hypothetical protein
MEHKKIIDTFTTYQACRFCFVRHIAAHVSSNADIFKGKPFLFTVYQFSLVLLPSLLLFPYARSPSATSHLRAFYHCMPIKRVAHCNRMAKLFAKKHALGWTASTITSADLLKAKEEGFLSTATEITFPSTEVIPQPESGYREMFLSFLLSGLSLPAHEFLHGLLFVYGM